MPKLSQTVRSPPKSFKNCSRIWYYCNKRLDLLLEDGLKVLLGLSGAGLHGLISRLPVGGADLAVRISILEGLNNTEDLVDIAANLIVVNGHRTQLLSRIDDEKSAKRVSGLQIHGAVQLRDLTSQVRDQRE